jgi:hypothetical protein
MKILYIEDEICQNIPGIIRLFERQLGKDLIKKLEKLDNDEYPATPAEIKELVESSNIIELEYNYPAALKKIHENHGDYSLFIIDRNLIKNQSYEHSEIREIFNGYTDEDYVRFCTREGDFLIYHLFMKKVDVLNKAFMLTAYHDEIKHDDKTKGLIDYNEFRRTNFIEKANEKDLDRLKKTIASDNYINIKCKYREVFRIFSRGYFDLEDERALMYILVRFNAIEQEKTKEIEVEGTIKDILVKIRVMIERILIVLNRYDENITPVKFIVNQYDKAEVQCRANFRYLVDKELIDKDLVIDKFNLLIYSLACDEAAHAKMIRSKYPPTIYTAQAFILMLFDILLWADGLMN